MAHRKLAIIRRHLFTILSVLSLLLCLATVALWVRSYSRLDYISYVINTQRWWSIDSMRGRIAFAAFKYADHFQADTGWSYESDSDTRAYRSLEELADFFARFGTVSSGFFLGFGFLSKASPDRQLEVCFPHWFLALLFAVLPALYLRAAIRSRKRGRAGLCPVCGYDLRATPERCPECGRANDEFQNRKSETMTKPE